MDNRRGQTGYSSHGVGRGSEVWPCSYCYGMQRGRKAAAGKPIGMRATNPARRPGEAECLHASSRLVTGNHSTYPAATTVPTQPQSWEQCTIVFALCNQLQRHRIWLDLTDVQLCRITSGKWQLRVSGPVISLNANCTLSPVVASRAVSWARRHRNIRRLFSPA